MQVSPTAVPKIFHVTFDDVATDAQIGYLLCARLNSPQFETEHGVKCASVLETKYDPGHKTVLVVTTCAECAPRTVLQVVAAAADQCLRSVRALRVAVEHM
jgi:hypothetical protein